MHAVSISGDNLEYVPGDLITYDLCLAAVTQDGYAVKYIPVSKHTYNTEIAKLYLAAVNDNGWALDNIPMYARTLEICTAAVKQDDFALKYLPDNYMIVKHFIKDNPCIIKNFKTFNDEQYMNLTELNPRIVCYYQHHAIVLQSVLRM